jgi:hypothetical protein
MGLILREVTALTNDELWEIVNNKFADLERNLSDRNKLVEKALEKADEVMTLRLDRLNHVKEQLSEQNQTFVRKDVCAASHVQINNNFKELFQTVNRLIGIGIVIQMIIAAALVWLAAYLK